MKDALDKTLSVENFKQCTLCAYQESGHILFAYLCGYRCQQAELIEGNEEDFSSISIFDYGEDAYLVSKFLERRTDYFTALSLAERLECIEVGRKLSLFFLGGSVAAAIFNNDGNVQIPLPMQIEYSDLLHVEFIDQVLETLESQAENHLIENRLQDALYTLSNVNVWETITDLSQRLLQHHLLNRNDIEECLEEHGIIYNEASPLQTYSDL
jgi:hypothetical protein